MAALAVLRLAACGVTAPAMVDGFRIQPLPPAKAHFLLHTWSKTAYDARANGFRPQMEATGEMATKLKALAEELPRLAAQANVLGLCERGSMRFDALAEPHASAGERLAKTRLVAALSAGKGSALAFVSEWEERVSIDACVVNPAFLVAGEGAERTLIRHVAREAAAAGVRCVRLLPAFQVEGVGFYEACGFFPVEGGEGELEYRAE
ncbi:hypothetical protein AB1Y20_013663 [Prymnesium parvum]|uniref:N-acetyltransferase domain-containing protein n=1 Tax=Prymnesium parvum TaxID=97485 RepID=A0AB34IIV3_PRYPA|mmetsp:Transcript_22700/g.48208  ORF Transcript_22700/g.48208 Transcript_22700/m.48208 type:complete len:207 (+) Transcript_22700:19-639(+)